MKKKIVPISLFVLLAAWMCFVPSVLAAEEFHCEVLSLTGSATATDAEGKMRVLQEGDLIAKDDTVTTAESSVMNLAFDKEWKNVTRLEEKSKLKITSVYPAKLELASGGVFARLKSLPRNSSFEVKTPTAVATVRGTEYRTTFIGGQTEVFNVSPSKVFVYGVSADGFVDTSQEVVLEQSRKTQVLEAGKIPEPSQDLSPEEASATEQIKELIKTKVQDAQSAGRISTIQSVSEMEAHGVAEAEAEALKKEAALNKLAPNESDESRVVDLRRRPFKRSE